MKILSASRLKLSRECAAKERLSYAERWRSVRDTEPLRFGTLMHAGLETWWLSAGDIDASLEALVAASSTETDPYELERAKALLFGYHMRWKPDIELYDVLGVEVEFSAPLINPESMRASRTWVMGGKIDAILRRKADGRVVIREFKTTSEEIATDSEDYWLKLSMDTQISFYVIGAESLGHAVDECLYDVIKKPGLRPLEATPLEKRKYTKEKRDKAGNLVDPSRLYADQREVDETPEEYGRRIADELAASPDRYFRRREIPRLDSQIQDALFDCWQAVQTMTASHRAPRAIRNPDACFKYGSQCAFWQVCSLGADPADLSHLHRLQNPHPELTQGESNESEDSSAA